MQFKNTTPYDAICYQYVDIEDKSHHVVALCAYYQLKLAAGTADKDAQPIYTAHILNDGDIKLCLADEFYVEPNTSSIKRESDLAPYKPKCDVLVRGHAYPTKATTAFNAYIKLFAQDKLILTKELSFTGPREMVNLKPSAPKPTNKVPLRYEYALGGTCKIEDPDNPDKNLVFSCCYKNPVGCGWMSEDFVKLVKQSKFKNYQPKMAPQIMPKGVVFTKPLVSKPATETTAHEMAQVDFPNAAAGFSATQRSWAPRLSKAGTYDQKWLDERHPYLPKDFDFGYWNTAPEDQQIDFPDLSRQHTFVTYNLNPKGGTQGVKLPKHQAILSIEKLETTQSLKMNVDTIIYNSDDLTLKIVWRGSVPMADMPNIIECQLIDMSDL